MTYSGVGSSLVRSFLIGSGFFGLSQYLPRPSSTTLRANADLVGIFDPCSWFLDWFCLVI